MDGREALGNSWGPGESSVGRKRRTEKQSCWHRFSGQIPSIRLSRKTVHPRLFKWFAHVGRWDMHSFVGRGQHSKCTAVGRGFSGQISSIRLFRKTVHPRAAKVCKPWAMGHALLRWQGARLTEQNCWHAFFRTNSNSINAIVPKNRVPKTCQTVSKRWAKGHAGHAWEKALCWRSFHFARLSVRRCLVCAPFAAKQTKR